MRVPRSIVGRMANVLRTFMRMFPPVTLVWWHNNRHFLTTIVAIMFEEPESRTRRMRDEPETLEEMHLCIAIRMSRGLELSVH